MNIKGIVYHKMIAMNSREQARVQFEYEATSPSSLSCSRQNVHVASTLRFMIHIELELTLFRTDKMFGCYRLNISYHMKMLQIAEQKRCPDKYEYGQQQQQQLHRNC